MKFNLKEGSKLNLKYIYYVAKKKKEMKFNLSGGKQV